MNGIKSCRNRHNITRNLNYINKMKKIQLKESLLRLDKKELKLFYGILVHYWIKYKFFISTQNFYNLWCELNELCHDIDESFPEPHDDRELLRSYGLANPYYFIDILDSNMVIKFFCEYLSNRIDILTMIVNKLATEGLWAAYEYSNKALGLYENVEKLVSEAEEHLKSFS